MRALDEWNEGNSRHASKGGAERGKEMIKVIETKNPSWKRKIKSIEIGASIMTLNPTRKLLNITLPIIQ